MTVIVNTVLIKRKKRTMTNFKQSILNGIPDILPKRRQRNKDISHAPNRKDILNKQEKKLAIINALRYFPKYMHNELAPEFLQELKQYGVIILDLLCTMAIQQLVEVVNH